MKKIDTNKVIGCQMSITLIFVFALIEICSGNVNYGYGILAAESSTEKDNFCIVYVTQFGILPQEKSQAEFHILQDDSKVDWCFDQTETDPKSKIILVSDQNCTISTQALHVQDRGGKGVLLISPAGNSKFNFEANETSSDLVNITVGFISDNSVLHLQEMGSTVTVRLYAPIDTSFDYSLIVIWIIAMFTICVGAYWSGYVRYTIYCKETKSLPTGEGRGHINSISLDPYEGSSLNISSCAIGFFVMCMGLMLVLLYFLYSYLVYVLIGLFVIASIVAVYSCLEPLVVKIPHTYCKYKLNCGGRFCHVDIRRYSLFLFALAISVFWVINRNRPNIWILQDVLGVAFCIHMLKSIRLPNLKICTVLLVLLFFYDIFFVFITPFFTSKGESVMEEVATGGSSSEMLPMVLKVSHFGLDPLSTCFQPFSILGYGDILIPGLLVSYCHGFDLVTSKRKIYFLTTLVTYGIGLLVTFVALFLMDTAQPALLYLVPCTLLPLVLLGWCRGEITKLWNGFKVVESTDASSCPEVQVASNNNPKTTLSEAAALPPFDSSNPPKVSVNAPIESETNVERTSLLH